MVLAKTDKNPDFQAGQVLLMDKPLTWSSFQLVKKVRNQICKKYRIKKIKVGHAGTLDPLATGLMLICVGKATKTIENLKGFEKEYTGTFTLGATTPSYDLETEVDEIFPLDKITTEKIEAVRQDFLGHNKQIPPIFSAIKVDGKRVYKAARKGQIVEIQPRDIFIRDFDVTSQELPNVDFRIQCSKGTYIRSIASDFGKKLDNGAHLSKLVRTKVGDYSLENAWTIEEFVEHLNGLEI